MAKKMLIDSTHPEETRVVVVNGNKIEEFDFDSSSQSLISGNIYLAKVSRVEPSLQAAFVDYGGNRQGFLAFSEIHPDYYQIPQADREALMQEEIERQREEAEEEEEEDEARKEASTQKRGKSRSTRRARRSKTVAQNAPSDEVVKGDVLEDTASGEDAQSDASKSDESSGESNPSPEAEAPAEDVSSQDSASTDENAEEAVQEKPKRKRGRPSKAAKKAQEEAAKAEAKASEPEELVASAEEIDELKALDGASDEDFQTSSMLDDPRDPDPVVEEVAVPDAVDEVDNDRDDVEQDIRPKPSKKRTSRPHNRYKIQEVIKPRQIMLVQVVKEERGNKGAALSTYISLPGRYCVLMPNTARGGGISRKISNVNDRKRLRTLAKGFNVPQGAGLIVRTAGAKQDAEEIERDYAFLTRQWNQIRELTLTSTAPAPVYEESGPIKRAIRDLLTNDTDEILIEGEAGFAEAKDYMEVLMPERISSVKLYQSKMPLFSRYQVENYLSSMFNPTVQLKSGGYLVIGVTEALVAIDVNSGRSTKEASIEDTALKTNLEAAEEVARQLKLRDLAGLIVIDFIDMEQYRHKTEVENKLKDCLRKDRARIQVGRISSFGLLEMSRQRLRTGLVEAITQPCPHCHGTGIMRSEDSIALSVIRAIEEEIARGRANEINAQVSPAIANYLFNEKRQHIFNFLDQHGVLVRVTADPALHVNEFNIEKLKNPSLPTPKAEPVNAQSVMNAEKPAASVEGDETTPPKRRRSRGGRGRKKNQNNNSAEAQENAEVAEVVATEEVVDKPKKSRSTRSRKKKPEGEANASENTADNGVERTQAADSQSDDQASSKSSKSDDAKADDVKSDEKAKPKRKRRTKAEIAAEKADKNGDSAPAAAEAAKVEVASEEVAETKAEAAPAKPKRKRRTKAEIEAEKVAKETKTESSESIEAAPQAEPVPETVEVSSTPAEPPKPERPKKKRSGWWNI